MDGTMELFEYLSSGSVNHIWLDNLVAFHKRQDITGMQDFLHSNRVDDTLFLKLYEAAIQYSLNHDKFYSLSVLNIQRQTVLKSILTVLEYLISTKQYSYDNQLYMNALELAIDSMDVEVERAGVMLASLLLRENDTLVKSFFASIINKRPERPSILDFRRLCFIMQLSIESGHFTEDMAVFKDKLPKRNKYTQFAIKSEITLEDIIEEIPLYSGKHECIHECYHD